jgi:hypothetical protein
MSGAGSGDNSDNSFPLITVFSCSSLQKRSKKTHQTPLMSLVLAAATTATINFLLFTFFSCSYLRKRSKKTHQTPLTSLVLAAATTVTIHFH